uniref:RRM domain-containing protein n=1 Tax=Haptolina brevifila TaxID=156173 RepID=A0A7S2NB46_9EUKA|mmetsp:Transcript_72251/g.143367  ORF Transcript_72251/g.143367 Transcript_72251/m.143367 type:complete len:278 (+) Transcript_72251:1156-1989(+)
MDVPQAPAMQTRMPSRMMPVLHLRGLPFSATDADVRAFFEALDVIDVLIVTRDGRPSGMAYVVFGSDAHVEAAMSRDKQNMGHRYIEISSTNRAEYYAAIAAHVAEASSPKTGAMLMPPGDGSHPSRPGDWQCPQCMAVVFGSRSSCFRCQAPRPNPMYAMDASAYFYPAQLYPAQLYAPDFAQQPSASQAPAQPSGNAVTIRGLPWAATELEVVQFFDGLPLSPHDVTLLKRPDGRSSGEGIVTFSSSELASAAVAYHNRSMGSRYIEVFLPNQRH